MMRPTLPIAFLLFSALMLSGCAEELVVEATTFSCGKEEKCTPKVEYCERMLQNGRPGNTICKPIANICPDGIPKDSYGDSDPCACPGADITEDTVESCRFTAFSSPGEWELTVTVRRPRP